MTIKDLEKGHLITFAMRQAGPKASVEQVKCICYCIRNRVRAGWCDGKWLSVIEYARESAAHTPAEVVLDDSNPTMQRMLREIDEIVFGQAGPQPDGLDELVDDQKYWMFAGRPVLPWFQLNICECPSSHPNKSQMGLMMFFD